MSGLTLEQQARRESGLGLSFAPIVNLSSPNGNPNLAAQPLDEGIDVDGYIWATYSIRPTGGDANYRVWILWKGASVWDCIEGSAKSTSINATNRPRVAGAARLYVEWLGGAASSVDVLYGRSTGIQAQS